MITDKVDSGATGVIFNIQRYTVHDGPGTRTELFLKGCPLRCLWCSNPEGFNIKPEIGVYPDRCIGIDKCGYCLQACTEENKDKEIIGRFNNLVKEINRDLCTNCLKCAEVCPGSSLVVWGKEMTVQETLQEVLKDRVFYGNKGGVTISGGEPLVQWKFTLEFLKACKNAGINTCIESTFHTPWDVAEQVLKYTDYILTDIKLMDSNKHKECTGVGNELILANLAKMSKMGIPYILRTPIVPNFNDDDENIHATASFIANEMGNTVKQVQLLAFHEYGKVKYPTIGRAYPLEGYSWPDRAQQKARMLELVDIMRSYSVPAVVGSNNKVE
jgi:pyruvate formate lyase activating enzyme